MANLNFNFTFKDGVFCLCCTVKGTTTRHYKEVSGIYQLSNPNFKKWDKKEQRFIEPTLEAISNNKFCYLDLTIIPHSGVNRMFYKELYRDFCIFLYEMKMRPCDVIRLHTNNINNSFIVYVAEKKKNYLDEHKRTTCVKLTETAKRIVCKYRGKSTKGYVFPFTMNNYDWDFDNAVSWNKWQNRKQKTLQDINEFLHKFESILHVKEITLYTFRHSAFTHAVNAKGSNLMRIAREGSTSIDMLENHYYHLQDTV